MRPRPSGPCANQDSRFMAWEDCPAGPAGRYNNLGSPSPSPFDLVFGRALRARPGVILSLAIAASSCSPQAQSVTPNGLPTGTTDARSSATSVAGGMRRNAAGAAFAVLHVFVNRQNAVSAPLVGLNGVLYGALRGGEGNGAGSIFSITPSGTYRAVYKFRGGADGAGPRHCLRTMAFSSA